MKELAVFFALVATISGGFLSWGGMKANQEIIIEDVKEVEEEIAEASKRIIENEKIDLRQSIILERAVETLDKLEKKL